MMLTEYYNHHRDAIEPALGLLAPAAAGRLLPTPPPVPQPRTVGDPTRTLCACCYGFGQAAGDCPSDPHLTATACAFCCIAGHTLESCKRKPERWALGGGRSTRNREHGGSGGARGGRGRGGGGDRRGGGG